MNTDEKLILSLFDYTGAWAQPYIDAGYPVLLWDKQIEGDILLEDGQLSDTAWKSLMGYSSDVYGILAAPPCTYFAASGARWWPLIPEESLTLMIALAQLVMIFAEHCENLKFWALENPVGRIEKLIPELKPYRRMSFDPLDYGDPYTKKTILWGNFNTNLYSTPAINLYGSMMHKIPPSVPNRQALRSATPKGFARAFFNANR
ncbi:hypothetical protein GCM10027347_44910 [Larkinella harenae]